MPKMENLKKDTHIKVSDYSLYNHVRFDIVIWAIIGRYP